MLPFDHKNGSAAARLIAVLAIAGVLSTSALTALAAVIDEAPDALAVLLEEGEAPDVEEAPTEETATPGEEADSSEGEAVPAEETEAPEEAPDADSPDAPTEEDEPEAPADETSEETAEEAPEGEGAESVPEEGISAQPPVPTVSAEAVPVPPEELPDSYFYGKVDNALIEVVAPEIASLNDMQKEQIIGIWEHNCLVYNSAQEMLAVYQIDGLSVQAAYILTLANIDGHVAYIDRNFKGADQTYLAAYRSAYETACAALSALGTANLAEEDIDASLISIIETAYREMRWAEENEELGTGEAALFQVANTYWNRQATEDVRNFFAFCAELT